jgi:hypothetical protein
MIYTAPLLIPDPIAIVEIRNLMWGCNKKVLMRVAEKSKRAHVSPTSYNKINKKPTRRYYNNNLLKDYIETYTQIT